MLRSLTLTNFRCFREHEISFSPLNIAVGLNNAGKTTVAEALRILSVASSKLRTLHYREPPGWLFIPKALVGYHVSLQHLQINFESLFHRYGAPPAMLEADFGSRGRLRVYIAAERQTHCVAYDGSGRVIRTQQAARKSKVPRLDTLPQVGPVNSEEVVLNPDYVRGALSSRLAPIHFRNQLNLLFPLFPSFQDVVQETWPSLQVKELVGQGSEPGTPLHLEVRDGDFVGEIGIMGHGLQMWLQTMWFLIRAKSADTVVLDEPDVYMHADLQRKLIRFVRTRFPQVIITTHSTEIMSEVSPEDILVIDKNQPHSLRADSLPAVQRVMTSVGSAHNVHLARLWTSRRFLMVEGDDLRLFRGFQNAVDPKSRSPVDAIPNGSIGGWSSWRLALGSSLTLRNASGSQIMTYCILDSDYHCPSQIQELQAEFESREVQLHIWERKEIENYLLVPAAIARAVSTRAPKRTPPPTEGEVASVLERFARELDMEFLDNVAQEFLVSNRPGGLKTANRSARAFVQRKLERLGPLGGVSGKAVLRRVFAWAQEEFGVSLSAASLATQMTPREVDSEIKGVLKAIEECQPFPPQPFADWYLIPPNTSDL